MAGEGGSSRTAPGRWAIIATVSTPFAELSSVATALEELRQRVAAIADRAADQDDDDTASELFAVERALTGAERRLNRITSGTRRRA